MDYGKLTKDQLSILLEDKGIPYSSSWTKEKMEEKLIEFEEKKASSKKNKNDSDFNQKMNGKLPHIIVSSVLAIIFLIITIIMIALTDPHVEYDPWGFNNYNTMLPIDIISFIITIIILIVLLIFIFLGMKKVESEGIFRDKNKIGIYGKIGAIFSLTVSIVMMSLMIAYVISLLSLYYNNSGDYSSMPPFEIFVIFFFPLAVCIVNIIFVSLYLKKGPQSKFKTAAWISSIFGGLIVSAILIFID